MAGDLVITSEGAITAGNGTADGIRALSQNDGSMSIDVDASIEAGENAVDAEHQGNGDLTIDISADAKGGSGYAIKTATKAGHKTTLTISSSTVQAGSGKAILNNEGDSDISVASSALVKGKISLGDGTDILKFDSGADVSQVTLFDGGDDIHDGDGWVDVLTFNGITANNVNADNIKNWERFELKGNSTVAFTGSSLQVGKLLVAAGSTANFGGASVSVAGDLQNDGVVTLKNNATGDVLTVDGDYSGNGVVELDTVVGDSGSPTDQLVIKGDNNGTIAVKINNVGGTGANTGNGPTDGIHVVDIQGANNGTLTLAEPVTAGAYTYMLTSDGYLQTQPSGAATAAAVTATLLPPTMESMWERLSSTWAVSGQAAGGGVRTAGFTITPTAATPLDLVSGFWLRGRYRYTKADSDVTIGGTLFTAKVKRHRLWAQLGYTHELNSSAFGRLVGSVYAQYLHTRYDTRNAGAITSKVKGDGFGGGLSATWLGENGLYGDILGEISRVRLTFTDVATSSSAKTWATVWRVSLEGGYRVPLTEKISLIPQAQLHVAEGQTKDFSIGATTYDVHSKAIATGRLGVSLEAADIELADNLLLTGQMTAGVLHDFGDGGYVDVGGSKATSKLARTRVELRSTIYLRPANSNISVFFEDGFSHSLKGPKLYSFVASAGFKLSF